MTAGNPLTPADWDVPGNVLYDVYSASNTLGGYTLATPAYRIVDAINLSELTGIVGLRFRFTRTASTYSYHFHDLQVHD